MPIYIDERSGLSVQQIKAQCYGVKKREGQIGLIVIDYIGLMAIGGGKNSNRAQDIGDVSRALKSFAKEMKCPILLLVQLNRGIEQRSDKKPVMSDLRESGCLEQDADIILLSGGVNDQVELNHELESLGELTDGFDKKLNKATLYGALEYMLRQAVFKWSNKTILYVLPHRMTQNLDYRNAVLAACKKYGVPVVDLMDSTMDFYTLSEFKVYFVGKGFKPLHFYVF